MAEAERMKKLAREATENLSKESACCPREESLVETSNSAAFEDEIVRVVLGRGFRFSVLKGEELRRKSIKKQPHQVSNMG